MDDKRTEKFGTQRGQLKILIGAAPGVGKTYTMLREANTLKAEGKDIVIGFIEDHQRKETQEQCGELERMESKKIRFQARTFEEIDVQAIVLRHPEIVVIDELAHRNTPGSLFPKRYMDVEYLLDQGISVLTAVNVQHIEGIHLEVEELTGIVVRELIPPSFVKRADELSVIDVTPETIRQRLRDGVIYPVDHIEHALTHYFRKSNLAGLREIALRLVAQDVNERLERSYLRSKIPGPVGVKEVIIVCVGHYERAKALIARGSRMADRMKADFYVLTILRDEEDSLSRKEQDQLEQLRAMVAQFDATLIIETRHDRKIGKIIAQVAHKFNGTQIVIGQPLLSSWKTLWFKERPVQYLMDNLQYTDLRIVGWYDPEETTSHSSSYLIKNHYQSFRHVAGRLTIYAGAAPGVGKTYKMLQDALDWRMRQVDVVVGFIETHGRQETASQLEGHEVIPRKKVIWEGRTYEEMDIEAIMARRPTIVLVDELAHSNVPGSRHEKRYQDILDLLEKGIHVVTTVNIQHLESLHDKVEHITGISVRERVPDWFMKMAKEIKLIDVTPEVLQARLLDGKIYQKDKIEWALANFFQIPNLSALRELALLEVADDVDQRMHQSVTEKKGEILVSERILVCVNHRPHSEKLLRRGWRIADRLKAELWVLVVVCQDTFHPSDQKDLDKVQKLSEQFGAHFLTVQASKQQIGEKIVETAKDLGVSQLVAGQPSSAHQGFGWKRHNPLFYVLDHAEFVDLHIVAYEEVRKDNKGV